MKCKQCGFENPLTTQYCRSCGAPVQASLDDVSLASQEDFAAVKKQRTENILLTILIVLLLITIPFIFFYFLLPQTKTEDSFVTVPYTIATIPQSSMLKETKINVSESVFPLPFENMNMTSSNYVLSRLSKNSKKILLEFFNGSNKDQQSKVDQALQWVEQKIHEDNRWGNKQNGFIVTSLALLSFLGEGYSTRSQEYGYMLNKSFNTLYTKKYNRLSTINTLNFSIALLAFIENSLMDSSFEYNNKIRGLLVKLKDTQDKKAGGWPRKMGAKQGRQAFDEWSSLFAIRTIGEAELAGLTELSSIEREITLEYLSRRLRINKRKKAKPEIVFNKAMIIYDMMLIQKGNISGDLSSEIDQIIDEIFSGKDNALVSIPAAHFLLLTLHRIDDRRFFSFKEALFISYNGSFKADPGHWPKFKGENTFLSLNSKLMATVLILRSYAFPHLYPRIQRTNDK